MKTENYTVSYVTPQNNQDARELAQLLVKHGATGMSMDGNETTAVWPTQAHEQHFNAACEQEA